LKAEAQGTRPRWKEFAVPFGASPLPGESRLVLGKRQRNGKEPPVLGQGILGGRRGKVRLRRGLGRREVRNGKGAPRAMQEAHGRLMVRKDRTA